MTYRDQPEKDTNSKELSLDSREYKIILKPSIFKNNEKGRDKLVRIINNLAKGQHLVFESKLQDEKIRNTWYLDTKKKDLYYKNMFLPRIREELDKEDDKVKGYDVTFKNRHPDRLLARSYDVSNSNEKQNQDFSKKEIKFEEDILTPFTSKFSTSVKLEYESLPMLKKYQDLKLIFPNLNLNIFPEEKMRIVNGFVAYETSYTLGKLKFSDKSEARLQYSLWYKSEKSKSPVIAEFDIDLYANEAGKSNKTLLEGFSIAHLNQVYEFYQAFQQEDIVQSEDDEKTKSKSPKTKTQYAYKYKK